MRPRGEALLREAWMGGGGAAGLLIRGVTTPLEWVMWGVVTARDGAYRRKWLRSASGPIPVISVGNLTVGGTGKTPITGWVVGALREAGFRPAVVSRGYGDDELALHRRWNPGAPVLAAPRRMDGVRAAAGLGADVAVLDDGFQHRALRRELDLVLLSVEQWGGGVRLLPRGPWREGLEALGRAHRVLVTRRVAGAGDAEPVMAWLRRRFPELPVHPVLLRPRGWKDLAGNPVPSPSGPALAVTGIAGPEDFAAMVAVQGIQRLELVSFPDHHAYRPRDATALLELAGGRPILTTEKDAVKLEAFPDLAPQVRVLTLEVVVEEGEEDLRRALREASGGGGR